MLCHHSKPSTSSAASLSNPPGTLPPSDLTEDIILSILKYLPVKSIIRFKCVSKYWLSLLSTPNFISIHREEEASKSPLNESFIIHSLDKDGYHKLFLLKVNSRETEPIPLFYPFHGMLKQMKLVGTINGLMCLSSLTFGQVIILWNPAMNLYKPISFCIHDEEDHVFSLGFAYDSLNDDYKIIRISWLKRKSWFPDGFRNRAEVYSTNLESWKSVPIDFHFHVYGDRSNVIAKGIPYWYGVIYEANNQYNASKALVYYDMQNGSFKHIPMPRMLTPHNVMEVIFVEWKGNLGVIVSSQKVNGDYFADILVYDEMGTCWKEIFSHGPIGLKMKQPLQCSKEGLILTETPEWKLMSYDPLTKGIKTFSTPQAPELFFFEAFGYTESLVTFKGMEQVKEQDKDNYIFRQEGIYDPTADMAYADALALFD